MPGRWYHLLYARARDQVGIQVDGVVVGTADLPAEVFQTKHPIVGKLFVSRQHSFRFTGRIDELTVWDGAISESEIQWLFELHRQRPADGKKPAASLKAGR